MGKISKKIIIASSLLSIGSLVACQTFVAPNEETPFVEEVINYEKIKTVKKEGLYLEPN